MVLHPDHDEGGLRSGLREGRQRVQTGVAQHRLLDDDDGRRQPPEQPNHVREIGGRGKRLDSGLALEQLPERGSHSLVTRGDEDRNLHRFVGGSELRDHPVKHRPSAAAHHRGMALTRRP